MDPILRANLYAYAFSFVGKPYRWGGDDPIDGFDCSGYCNELLLAAGVLPYGTRLSAQGIHDYLISKLKGHEVIQGAFGVLVFYGESKTDISHVCFCLSAKSAIGADGGSPETTTDEKASAMNAFVKMRDIRYRSDLVAFVLPSY